MKKSTKRMVLLLSALLVTTALWMTACGKGNRYTIAFFNGGGSAVESIVAGAGTTIDEPTAPTKQDYVFDGWYRDVDLLDKCEFPLVMPEESFNLYAKWRKSDRMKLTFDPQGGEGNTTIYGSALQKVEEPKAPIKQDRVFSGWFFDEACTMPFDFIMPARDATVYARWLKLEQATGFELNKDWISPDNGAYALSAEGGITTVRTLPGKGTYSYIGITIPYNVKDYAAFMLTFTGTAGEDLLLKCQNGGVTVVETRTTMTGTADQTFVWTVKPENLTDGTAPMNFYIFVRPGLTGGDAELKIKSLTLYRVRGEEDPYQSAIFFDTQGGSPVQPIFAETGSAVAAPETECKKPGYTFAGWYTDTSYEAAFTFNTMPAGKTFAYAKWTPNSDVTLTFDSKGGTPVDPLSQPATADISKLRPEDPVKSNVIFEDWYLDEQFTQRFTFTTMPEESTTVYARWTELENASKITLTDPITAMRGYTVTDTAEGTRVEIAQDKSTYEMFGTTLSLNAKAYSHFSIVFTGTAGKKILFKCQHGGVKSIETSVVMTGEKQTVLWRLKSENLPDGTEPMKFYMCLEPGTAYETAPDPAISVVVESIALLRLKDAGTTDRNAVHFVTDGGRDEYGQPLAPLFVTPGEALMLPSPAKAGYEFVGWYTDAALENAFTATAMPDENLILYAKYAAALLPYTFDPTKWGAVPGFENYKAAVKDGEAVVAFNHTDNAWSAKSGASYEVVGRPVMYESPTVRFTLNETSVADKETVVRIRFYAPEENYTYNGSKTPGFQFIVKPDQIGKEQTVRLDIAKLTKPEIRAHYEALLQGGTFNIAVNIYTGSSSADYGTGILTIHSVVFR